jgi:hypothetical protein
MWLNFHCDWEDEGCAQCGNSFRVTSDHHDVWDDGSSGCTSAVIRFLADSRQDYWGPDPDYGWCVALTLVGVGVCVCVCVRA